MKKTTFYKSIGFKWLLESKFYAFLLLFIAFLFFHFYQLEDRAIIGWDQVDNAWAAVRILDEHNYPMRGMMAKLNSGIGIGPLYYYLVALFYAITRFDPIASPLLAGFTSVIGFFTLFFIVKKLHGWNVALVSLFVYTFSYIYILSDRVQWPVNFIPILSFIIFYCLYRVCMGSAKHVMFLSIALGLSFHIHFTSVFYIPIILASLPFIPRTKQMLSYGILSFIILCLFFIPEMIYQLQREQVGISFSSYQYISTYYHGFHLRRLWQLAHDGFIEIERAMTFKQLRPFVFIVPFLYSLFLWRERGKRHWFILTYLSLFWIVVPWVVFSLYSGEISKYYFSMSEFLAIMFIAYIGVTVWNYNNRLLQFGIFFLMLYYGISNAQLFINHQLEKGLYEPRKRANERILSGDPIPFADGDMASYIYYIRTTRESKNLFKAEP